MMVYRVDADAAFDLLKWRSQECNIKLRAIAEQLLADFRALDYDDTLPPRSIFDQLLLTTHERVGQCSLAGSETGDGPAGRWSATSPAPAANT
jgi:hypothetical protein